MIDARADSEPQVVVIDYGVGNIRSVTNALGALGYRFALSSSHDDIAKAQALILPGVGAFEEAMSNLRRVDVIGVLEREVLEKKKPLLGICLGMQVLAEDSTENGEHQGLGWIPGHIVKITGDAAARVPHVGWNQLTVVKREPLFTGVPADAHFYFDHSYHFKTDRDHVAATVEHGGELTAAVQKSNIAGVQFHPEKSQTSGLRLLRSFMTAALERKSI